MDTKADRQPVIDRKGLDAAITDVCCVPLVGEIPKGGWSHEIQPEDSIHAIIAVHTRCGLSGYGSTFTDGFMAREAVRILTPFLIGENAAEVGRLTETLQSKHLLDGPWRCAHSCDQRHKHRFVGFAGQGERPVDFGSARRPLQVEGEALRFVANG